MVRLIGLRPVWLPRGTLSNMAQTFFFFFNMAQTIMIPFLRWPRLSLFACFFLWLLCVHGLFFNWISRMSFFMVNSPRRFIWSNHLVLLLRGRSGLVYKLHRSLYGLKQSPRAWFSRFSLVVQKFGMIRSVVDHSVFYHHSSIRKCIYLIVYVDNIVITGSDRDGI